MIYKPLLLTLSIVCVSNGLQALRYKNESPKSIDELDLKAAQYIKHYAAKTVRNINKQAHINEKALINLQRRRYFLSVSGVSTYLIANVLGLMGSYWNTERLTNGVAAQIFATAVEDGSYDAEIIHGILPEGNAALADTSCLNRDTIRTVNEGSMKIDQMFNDISYNDKSNGSDAISFSSRQGVLVQSRQFRKQTEGLLDCVQSPKNIPHLTNILRDYFDLYNYAVQERTRLLR